MPYRLTLGLCGLIVATTAAYAGVRINIAAGFSVAVIQAVVFAMPAAFAFACRRYKLASYVVLAATVLTGALAGVFLTQLVAMHSMAAFGWAFHALFLECAAAFFGGYLGYACMEAERLRPTNPGHVRGKLTVVGLIAMVMLAVVILFVAGTKVGAAAYAL